MPMLSKTLSAAALLLLLAAPLAGAAQAQPFVYQPKNPAFGGSYLNYSWLLSSAQAQKSQEASTSSFDRDPLADFENSLQRQVLSALSRELVYNRFRDLDLSQEGTYDLGDYLVEIVPGLDGVNVKVFNTLTGDETTVTIPNY